MARSMTTFVEMLHPNTGILLVGSLKGRVSSTLRAVSRMELGTALLIMGASFVLFVGTVAYSFYPTLDADNDMQLNLFLVCALAFAFTVVLLLITPSSWWYESTPDKHVYARQESWQGMLRDRQRRDSFRYSPTTAVRPVFKPKRPVLPQAHTMPKASCLYVRFSAYGSGVMRKPIGRRSSPR